MLDQLQWNDVTKYREFLEGNLEIKEKTLCKDLATGYISEHDFQPRAGQVIFISIHGGH